MPQCESCIGWAQVLQHRVSYILLMKSNLVDGVSHPDLTLILAQLCSCNGTLSQCEDPRYYPILVSADYRTHVSMQVHHFGP